MQLSNIGKWLGQMLPGGQAAGSVDKEVRAVDGSQANKADPESKESTEHLGQAKKIRYLAQKYNLNQLNLKEWKDFQVETTQLGLSKVRDLVDFAKDIEPGWFHDQKSQDVKGLFEVESILEAALKTETHFTTKRQAQHWLNLTRSVKAAQLDTVDTR